MSTDYSANIVKDYAHWTVYVHVNQGYLGRCVIWCKREDALDLMDATSEEWSELRTILGQLKAAIGEAFHPDWFNYSFLGNETRHLHGHLVPRYASPQTFMGMTYDDVHYGHNFRADPSFVTPDEVRQEIKKKIAAHLAGH